MSTEELCEEIAFAERLSIHRCMKTARKWKKQANEYLAQNGYDWRVEIDATDKRDPVLYVTEVSDA